MMRLLSSLCLAFISLVAVPPPVHAATTPGPGQVATLTVRPFDRSVSFRQDFCPQYRRIIAGAEDNDNTNNSTASTSSLELKNALNGVELHVLLQYGDNFPYFNYDNVTGIDPENPGLVVQILDEIAKRANFTWRNSFGVYNAALDKGADRSWTELLLWTADTFDISIDKWAQSTERLNSGIAYCDAWFDSSIILIDRIEPVGQDETKVKWFNWMRPFNSAVWAVTGATVVASALVYQFLEHLGGHRQERSWRRWFMDNLYLSSINFTQNYTYEPPTLAGRIFGVSFAFWTMGTCVRQ